MLRYRLLPLVLISSVASCALAQETGLTNTTFLPNANGDAPAEWKFVDFGAGGKPVYAPRGA